MTGAQEVGKLHEALVENGSETTLAKRVPRSLLAFFFLSAAMSWTIWLWPFSKVGSVHVNFLGSHFEFPFSLLKLVIGNCLPGVLAIIWTLAEGKTQFRFLLSSLGKWRIQSKWYLLAVALPCGLFLAALELVLLVFPTDNHLPPSSQFFRSFLLTLPFGPLWEELAWRSFALRKLQLRYSTLWSALIIGAYWAVWHIPLWLLTLNLNPNTRLPVLSLTSASVVAWSIVFAYLYDRSSQSLPATILLHTTYVAASSQVFSAVPYGQLHLIEVSTALSVCVGAITAGYLRTDCRAGGRLSGE